MYAKPTEEQAAFNNSIATSLTVQPLPEQGLKILQHLSNAAGLEVKDTCVFAGRIDSADATKLACTLVEAYNEKEGGIYKAGKTFPGFNNYAQHIGRHDSDSQLVSSVIFKPSYLKKTSIAEWPELHKVFMEISAKLGESFEIVVSHVLFSKNQSVCFEYHQDTKDHAKNVDISVVVQLSTSKSTFNIAGMDSFTYDSSGSFFAFPSCLWHRSGVACSDTIKIAFFFKFKNLAGEKRAREEAEDVDAGASSVPPMPEFVKVEEVERDVPAPESQQQL